MVARAPLTVDRIVAEIMSGRIDSEISQIIEAITKKIRLGYLLTRWHIRWQELDVDEDSLTVDEAWQIEQVSDLDWKEIDPISSATHFRAMMQVLLRTRLNWTEERVNEALAALTVAEAAASITRETRPVVDDEGRGPLASLA